MNKLSVRLLLAAAVLLLIAGTLFGFTQSWIYASTRMDLGLSQVHELLCRGESAAVCAHLPVAAKARCCPVFGSVMAALLELPSGVDGERRHWRNT